MRTLKDRGLSAGSKSLTSECQSWDLNPWSKATCVLLTTVFCSFTSMVMSGASSLESGLPALNVSQLYQPWDFISSSSVFFLPLVSSSENEVMHLDFAFMWLASCGIWPFLFSLHSPFSVMLAEDSLFSPNIPNPIRTIQLEGIKPCSNLAQQPEVAFLL